MTPREHCHACPRHHERDGQHFCDAPFDAGRYDPRAATRWLNFAWHGLQPGCPEKKWAHDDATAKRVPRGIGWALRGATKAARAMLKPDTPQSLARLTICTGDDARPACEHFDPARQCCILCGCPSRLKARLHDEGETCPDGRWP